MPRVPFTERKKKIAIAVVIVGLCVIVVYALYIAFQAEEIEKSGLWENAEKVSVSVM